ncbi:MAG TPA: glycosyltransferase family 2 protein [Patescibacteria group bacterium]|nr:glycosyltransferase family 2 protein [Patescibacteria group bacterium]
MGISIIIPTRNRAALLTTCLYALFSQTEKPEEIIVVDNGSTDYTAQAVRMLQEISPVPLRYFYEGRRGPSYARNLGIDHARFPILGFLDDDTIPVSTWVHTAKHLVSLGVSVAQGAIEGYGFEESVYTAAERFYRLALDKRRPNYRIRVRFHGSWLIQISDLYACNFFCRREVIDRLGHGFDEELFPFMGEEKEFYMRLKRNGFPVFFSKAMKIKHLYENPRSRFLGVVPFYFFSVIPFYFSFGSALARLRQKYAASASMAEKAFQIELHKINSQQRRRLISLLLEPIRDALREKSITYQLAFCLFILVAFLAQTCGYWYGRFSFFLFHREKVFRASVRADSLT